MRLEVAMFAKLFEIVNSWFENAERRRREEYLAQSTDICELEYRIRALETGAI